MHLAYGLVYEVMINPSFFHKPGMAVLVVLLQVLSTSAMSLMARAMSGSHQQQPQGCAPGTHSYVSLVEEQGSVGGHATTRSDRSSMGMSGSGKCLSPYM